MNQPASRSVRMPASRAALRMSDAGARRMMRSSILSLTERTSKMPTRPRYPDPVQAAQITAWVQYVSPVAGVQEEVAKLDPELAESPWIFPTADFISERNIQQFRALDADEDIEFADLWSTKVMGN